MRSVFKQKSVWVMALAALMTTIAWRNVNAQTVGDCLNPAAPPGTNCQYLQPNPGQTCRNLQTCVTKGGCILCYGTPATCPGNIVCTCCKYTATIPYGNCAAPGTTGQPGCSLCADLNLVGPGTICRFVCATGNAFSDPTCAPGSCLTMVCAVNTQVPGAVCK